MSPDFAGLNCHLAPLIQIVDMSMSTWCDTGKQKMTMTSICFSNFMVNVLSVSDSLCAPSSSVEHHFLLEEQEPEGYTDHQTGMMFINDKYVPE